MLTTVVFSAIICTTEANTGGNDSYIYTALCTSYKNDGFEGFVEKLSSIVLLMLMCVCVVWC